MKKVFIGVLAALMLFAFTACENSTPNTPLYGKSVMAVTLLDQPDYIKGYDTIKAADLKIRVTYNDNSYTDYTGVELKVADGTTAIDKIYTPVTVTVPGVSTAVSNSSTSDYSVNVVAYEPDLENVTFDVSGAEQTTIALAATSLSAKGVTVTIPYGNGQSKTYDVTEIDYFGKDSSDELAFGAPLNTILDDIKLGDEIDVLATLKEYKEQLHSSVVNALASATGTWTVTVKGTEIKDVIINQEIAAATEIYSGAALSTVDYSGLITFTDGTAPVEFSKTTPNGVSVEFTKNTDTYELTKSESIAVKVTYNGLTYDTELPVKVQENYPVKFTVTPIGERTDAKFDYKEGQTVNLGNYTFAVAEWAKKDAPITGFTLDADDFNAPEAIKFGTATDSTQALTVNVTYKGDVGVKTVDPAVVPYDLLAVGN